MTTIKVSQADALSAASGFDNVTDHYEAVSTEVTAIEGTVFGSWTGQAANAAKNTITLMETCLGELADSVLAHAGLIKNAVGNYERTDEDLASATMNAIH